MITRGRWPTLAGPASVSVATAMQEKGKPLDITAYQPKSKLAANQSRIETARFSVVDVHTRLSFSKDEQNTFRMLPAELLVVMDRRNVRTMVPDWWPGSGPERCGRSL